MDELAVRLRPYQMVASAAGTAAGAYSALQASREALQQARDAVAAARSVSKTARKWWNQRVVQDTPHSHGKKYRLTKRSRMVYKTQPAKRRFAAKRKPARKMKAGKGKVATLQKQVTSIKKSMLSDQALHVHRRRDVQGIAASAGQVNNYAWDASMSTMLEAAMANLRYYNPSVPGTLTTADGSTGTYSRQIHFKSVASSLTLRNNYQVPCKVRVYLATPKQDTNVSPTSFYSSGVTDQTISVATSSPLLFLSDIDQVNENWKLQVRKNLLLQPGSQTTCTHFTPPFDYDPSIYDSHALQYQKKWHSFVWVVRVEGCIGHDTVANEWLVTQAAVDGVLDTKFTITYDAGVNLKDFSVDNNSSASFSNAGVVTNKPVADNQSYSQA